MKCVIPSQNVKIVARAIHSLARIGDELYIEPTGNELIFITISVAQSALCEFKMCRTFFSSYNSNEQDIDSKCKVAMKSCLNVFKNPHCFDKQVESCEMRLKPDGTVVIIYIKFTNSSTKKFFLPIIESEKVEVNFERNTSNRFVAPAKLLSSSVKNFRVSEDEITIKATREKMTIKNHLEPRRDKNLMRTELSFQPTEFDCYNVGNPSSVTFCLKELRAVISFAEPSNLPIMIQFEKPGEPIIFQVSNQPAYEATYVVATLKQSSMELEMSSASATSSKQNESKRSAQTPTTPANKSKQVESSKVFEFSNTSDRLPESSAPKTRVTNCEMDVEIPGPSEVIENNGEMEDLMEVDVAAGIENELPVENLLQSTNGFACPQIEVDPAEEKRIRLISVVFQRCFSGEHMLNCNPNNDIILCDKSDSE